LLPGKLPTRKLNTTLPAVCYTSAANARPTSPRHHRAESERCASGRRTRSAHCAVAPGTREEDVWRWIWIPKGYLSRQSLHTETGKPEMSNCGAAALFDPSLGNRRQIARSTERPFDSDRPDPGESQACPFRPFRPIRLAAVRSSIFACRRRLGASSGLRLYCVRLPAKAFACELRALLPLSDFVVIPLEAADWGAQGIVQVTAAVE